GHGGQRPAAVATRAAAERHRRIGATRIAGAAAGDGHGQHGPVAYLERLAHIDAAHGRTGRAVEPFVLVFAARRHRLRRDRVARHRRDVVDAYAGVDDDVAAGLRR